MTNFRRILAVLLAFAMLPDLHLAEASYLNCARVTRRGEPSDLANARLPSSDECGERFSEQALTLGLTFTAKPLDRWARVVALTLAAAAGGAAIHSPVVTAQAQVMPAWQQAREEAKKALPGLVAAVENPDLPIPVRAAAAREIRRLFQLTDPTLVRDALRMDESQFLLMYQQSWLVIGGDAALHEAWQKDWNRIFNLRKRDPVKTVLVLPEAAVQSSRYGAGRRADGVMVVPSGRGNTLELAFRELVLSLYDPPQPPAHFPAELPALLASHGEDLRRMGIIGPEEPVPEAARAVAAAAGAWMYRPETLFAYEDSGRSPLVRALVETLANDIMLNPDDPQRRPSVRLYFPVLNSSLGPARYHDFPVQEGRRLKFDDVTGFYMQAFPRARPAAWLMSPEDELAEWIANHLDGRPGDRRWVFPNLGHSIGANGRPVKPEYLSALRRLDAQLSGRGSGPAAGAAWQAAVQALGWTAPQPADAAAVEARELISGLDSGGIDATLPRLRRLHRRHPETVRRELNAAYISGYSPAVVTAMAAVGYFRPALEAYLSAYPNRAPAFDVEDVRTLQKPSENEHWRRLARYAGSEILPVLSGIVQDPERPDLLRADTARLAHLLVRKARDSKRAARSLDLGGRAQAFFEKTGWLVFSPSDAHMARLEGEWGRAGFLMDRMEEKTIVFMKLNREEKRSTMAFNWLGVIGLPEWATDYFFRHANGHEPAHILYAGLPEEVRKGLSKALKDGVEEWRASPLHVAPPPGNEEQCMGDMQAAWEYRLDELIKAGTEEKGTVHKAFTEALANHFFTRTRGGRRYMAFFEPFEHGDPSRPALSWVRVPNRALTFAEIADIYRRRASRSVRADRRTRAAA